MLILICFISFYHNLNYTNISTFKTDLVWSATQYTQILHGSFDGMWGSVK